MKDYAQLIGGPGPRPYVDRGQRIVAWFSHGDASAVATKLCLQKFGSDRVKVYCIDVGSEHSDNARFRADCERWFGVKIHVVKSAKYADTWTVWRSRRFLKGPEGAPCTQVLKRAVREEHSGMEDVQAFGFTAEEQDRAIEFAWRNPEIMLYSPLIEAGLGKNDCHAIVSGAGIEIPAMYRLGYLNNNCIGCVKGGMWYWNKIRQDFPETFSEMAKLERELDHAILKDRTGGETKPLFLDELKPGKGRKADEPKLECSTGCQALPDLENTDLV